MTRERFTAFRYKESFCPSITFFSLAILNIILQSMLFSYFESLTSRLESAAMFLPVCYSTQIILKSYVYWTMHHCNSWWLTDQLMSLAILFHFLCAQHVSDINISIIRTLRLCCWITTLLIVLFSVRCVLEIWCGWVWVVSVLQAWNTDMWNWKRQGMRFCQQSTPFLHSHSFS